MWDTSSQHHTQLFISVEKDQIRKGLYEGRNAFVFLNSIVIENNWEPSSYHSESVFFLMLGWDSANTEKWSESQCIFPHISYFIIVTPIGNIWNCPVCAPCKHVRKIWQHSAASLFTYWSDFAHVLISPLHHEATDAFVPQLPVPSTYGIITEL